MDFFNFVLGSKEEKVDTNKEIKSMKDTIDTFEKRESLLRKRINIELENAKKHTGKGNRPGNIKIIKLL